MAGRSTSRTLIPSVEPRTLNVNAAAVYLGATVWYVRNLAWNRHIPFLKFGNRILFDKQDLDRFIENQKTVAVQ